LYFPFSNLQLYSTLQLYLDGLSVIFHALACLHRLIAYSAISTHQHDVESAMLEHSLITALTWRDVQGSVCFMFVIDDMFYLPFLADFEFD
jgi:hypothetical protein